MSEVQTSGELCEMARRGKIERVMLLIQGKCDLNAADYDRRTCMHLAASEGNLHVINALVESGADLNAKDRWGGTALVSAAGSRSR